MVERSIRERLMVGGKKAVYGSNWMESDGVMPGANRVMS
jgi:hypothetical protein